MSLIHEAPRRRGAVPRFYRMQYADMESRRQLDEFSHEGKTIFDSSLSVDESMSVAGHAFSLQAEVSTGAQAMPISVHSPVTIAERRREVIKTLLVSGDQPATPAWRDFMKRNFDRIGRFAKTAVNKGKQIDPAFR